MYSEKVTAVIVMYGFAALMDFVKPDEMPNLINWRSCVLWLVLGTVCTMESPSLRITTNLFICANGSDIP